MNQPTVPEEGFQPYTGMAILLHWLLALLLLGSFCVGAYMADLKLSPERIRLFNYHKWAGVTILLLSALRLAWRLTHRPPPEPATLKARDAAIALWTHRLLYVLFFAVPIAGWAYSSASGFSVVWFGQIPLPDLVAKDKGLADVLVQVHGTLAWTLGALVALHAAAAIKHQLFDKDLVLARMLPAGARARTLARRGARR